MTAEELVAGLSDSLRERSRTLGVHSSESGGEFVLYWMRTAVRVDENPALDTAIEISNQLGLPVFVYHALSERYPYASDRHHTFILQAARDVQAAFAAKRIAYAFHLERPTDRGPHLRTLAERAAIVITEEMPVAPHRGWTRALGRGLSTPIVAVDTACVVPMQLFGKAHERAFAFRKATSKLYEERVTRQPMPVDPTAIGHSATRADYSVAHRWRYALPPEPLVESCLFDSEMQVAACGDWCGGPRVEGAFLSGVAAAGRVMGLLKTDLASIVPDVAQRSLF